MSMNSNLENKSYFDGQLNELVNQLSQQGIEPTGGATGGGGRRRMEGEVHQPTPNPSKGKLQRRFTKFSLNILLPFSSSSPSFSLRISHS